MGGHARSPGLRETTGPHDSTGTGPKIKTAKWSECLLLVRPEGPRQHSVSKTIQKVN